MRRPTRLRALFNWTTLATSMLAAGALAGCSFILDPENCSSDDDCLPGGACKSGVCIGGTEAAGGADAAGGGSPGGATGDADVGGTTPTPDKGVTGGDTPPPDMGTGGSVPDTGMGGAAGSGGTGGVGGEPPPPLNEPPTCAILTPPNEDEGIILAQQTLGLTIQVLDRDTPPESLTVTVNGAAAALEADGTATLDLPLREGGNDFLLVATDPQNHRCQARRRVVRDTEGPTLTLTGTDGQALGNDLQVATSPLVILVEATDANGMADVSVTARDLPVNDVTGPEGDVWTATVVLADGSNAIEVTGVDAHGNMTTQSVAVYYDGQDPEISIASPVDNQLVEANTIDVRGTARDNLGVTRIDASVTGAGIGQGPVDLPDQRPNADGSYRFPNVPLFAGDNTITVTALDGVRSASTVVHLRVEPGAPVVAFTTPNPEHDFITGSADVHLVGSASRSVSEVEVGPPGRTTTVTPSDGAWTADVRLPSQGTYVFTAIGRTPGGRSSTPATVTVLFDSSAPTIRLTRPAEGFCTAAPTLQVEGTAEDFETTVETVLANDTPMPVSQDQQRHFLDSIPVDEGMDQVLTVSGENGAGLTGEATRHFSVDRTGPVIALDVPDGAFIAAAADGAIEVRGTIADQGCGLAPLPLLVNGTETLASPEGAFVSRQNRGPTPHITLVGTDIVGNQRRVEVDYRVDANPPVIDELDPAGDQALRGNNIAISARVTDDESGLDEVTIGGAVVQAQNGRYGRTVQLAPGDNPIEIVARDNVGLERRVTLHINRDTVAPTVTITTPVANAFVEDKLIIEGTIADNAGGSGFDYVTVGNVDVVPEADGTWRRVGVPMLNGQQTISIVGYDLAGNQSQAATVTVTVRDFGVTAGAINGLSGATEIGWVGAADLNRDGRLDVLALADTVGGEGRAFVQTAAGDFESHPLDDLGLPADLVASEAAFADLNADARWDLIVAGPSGTSTVYLGNQASGFVVSGDASLPIAGDVTGLAVGDINRDGVLDVLFLAGADSALRMGRFGGGFVVAPLADIGDPDLTDMTRATLVDLTTDGVQELVAVGPGGSRAWRGDVLGTFEPYDAGTVPFGSTAARALFALDVDRDRDLDIVTLGASHTVHQSGLSGADIATFTSGALGLTAGATDVAGAGADFDGDARDDVVVFGANGPAFFGGGAAGFSARQAANLGLPVLPAARAGAAVDIDGDGDVDVLSAGAQGVTLLRNNATTTRAGTYPYLRVLATRALDGIAPVDSTGVVVYSDPLAVNPAANRALVHPVTGPLVVTFGAAQRADVTIQWVEKDGGGDNTITVANQRPQAANVAPITRQPAE